jgi:hypothetical protein
MKKTILIIIGYFILIMGIWVFITNILDNRDEANTVAGFGSMLIYAYVFLNDFWIKDNLRINLLMKILITLFSLIGIWVFVTNILETNSESSMLAGFGGALFVLGVILKKDLSKKDDSNTNDNRNFNTLIISIFVITLTLYGLHRKDIKKIESEVSDSYYSIERLDGRVDDLESKLH